MSLWTAVVYAVVFGGPLAFWLSAPWWMPAWMGSWSVLIFLAGYFAICAAMAYGNIRWHRHHDPRP